MKSLSRIVFVCLLALSIPACSSNGNNDDNNQNPGNGSLKASVDGSQFNAASATATKVTALGFTTLTIAGSEVSGRSMTISFVGVTAPGTYPLGGLNLISMSYIADAAGTTYIATSGTATITKIDNSQVKGTFSFEADLTTGGGNVSVTNGSFDVGYGFSI